MPWSQSLSRSPTEYRRGSAASKSVEERPGPRESLDSGFRRNDGEEDTAIKLNVKKCWTHHIGFRALAVFLGLAQVFFSVLSPLCATGFQEAPPESLSRLTPVAAPLSDVSSVSPLPSSIDLNQELEKVPNAKELPLILPVAGVPSIKEKSTQTRLETLGVVSASDPKLNPSLQSVGKIYSSISKALKIHSPETVLNESDFFDFYSNFVQDFDLKFNSPEYKSDRTSFIRDVEQSRFHASRPGVGEIEAKLIDGQVAIRFAVKGARPLIAVISNPSLAVDQGSAHLQVDGIAASKKAGNLLDPALGSKRLDTYRSRLLINRKIHPLGLLSKASFGEPYRTVLMIDADKGAALLSPALGDKKTNSSFVYRNLRWWKHWIKGTLEPVHYGDVFRGTVSASIQFGLAYGMAALAAHFNPSANAFTLGPAIASGVFALLIAVFSDSYAAFVQRGENRSWESTKRMMVSALLFYPLAMMQAHGDWHVIFTWQTNIILWMVGFGDRYLSTVMNVVPKIHQKYFMKPWFFSVRMEVPFRSLVGKILHSGAIQTATVKGVTMTRETLAIARFIVKFPGLFLDPFLMRYTHGIPVATLLLWGLALPFWVLNYRVVKKLAKDNPRIQEDLDALNAKKGRWFKARRFLGLKSR